MGSACSMGSGTSFATVVPDRPDDTSERNQNSLIEAMLLSEEKEAKEVVKILLLGPSDSGKTSFLKHLKLLYGNGFTDRELRAAIDPVRSNTLGAMQTILRACKNLEIPLDTARNRARAAHILELSADEASPELCEDLVELWKDNGVQAAYGRRNDFRLLSSARYFMDNLARTFHEAYMPTADDYLQVSCRSTGISEAQIEIGGVLYRFYDLGGQRGERKKWIHCFEDVTAVVFVASLADYDQVPDQGPKNRLYEAMDLFEGIVNLPFFKKCHTVLYLNKADLFREKLATVELGVHFPLYTGDDTFEDGLHFLREQFFDRFIHPERVMSVHVTNATDAANVRWVWDETRRILNKEPVVLAPTPTTTRPSASSRTAWPPVSPRKSVTLSA